MIFSTIPQLMLRLNLMEYVILCNFPNEFPCFFYSAPFIISCVTKFTNIEIFNIHYQRNV